VQQDYSLDIGSGAIRRSRDCMWYWHAPRRR